MSKTTLSPIIAGAMNWGVWDKNLSTKEMDNMIHLCLENKITTFDHADIYGDYTTEADFGKALISSKIDRTTIDFEMWHPNGDQEQKQYN
jgi:predicted oxidoreductase